MDSKQDKTRKFRKTVIAAACAVPYLIFAGGGGKYRPRCGRG